MTLETKKIKLNRTFNCRIYRCSKCDIEFLHYVNYQIHCENFHKPKPGFFNCC